jgi:hypothetical protein
MKKNLFFCFLILFVLNTVAFAGFSDPKNDPEKSPINNTRENKLSDEEVSRLSRRAETDNLSNPDLINRKKNDSKDNLKSPNQIYLEKASHKGIYIGGAVIILLLVLIIIVAK